LWALERATTPPVGATLMWFVGIAGTVGIDGAF